MQQLQHDNETLRSELVSARTNFTAASAQLEQTCKQLVDQSELLHANEQLRRRYEEIDGHQRVMLEEMELLEHERDVARVQLLRSDSILHEFVHISKAVISEVARLKRDFRLASDQPVPPPVANNSAAPQMNYNQQLKERMTDLDAEYTNAQSKKRRPQNDYKLGPPPPEKPPLAPPKDIDKNNRVTSSPKKPGATAPMYKDLENKRKTRIEKYKRYSEKLGGPPPPVLQKNRGHSRLEEDIGRALVMSPDGGESDDFLDVDPAGRQREAKVREVVSLFQELQRELSL